MRNSKSEVELMKKIFFSGLVLLMLMTAMSCKPKATKGVTVVGEVVFMENDVTLNNISVDIGDEAKDGDVLRTGEASYAEVVFGEQSIFRVMENTSVVLNARQNTLELDQGVLAVIQSKAHFLSQDDPWEIQTPTAVAAVRGTTYFIKVENADSTYICICNGQIETEDGAHGNTLELEASHHKAVRYIRNADGQLVVEDAPMIYHTDEEMESLADHIGTSIDWSRIP